MVLARPGRCDRVVDRNRRGDVMVGHGVATDRLSPKARCVPSSQHIYFLPLTAVNVPCTANQHTPQPRCRSFASDPITITTPPMSDQQRRMLAKLAPTGGKPWKAKFYEIKSPKQDAGARFRGGGGSRGFDAKLGRRRRRDGVPRMRRKQETRSGPWQKVGGEKAWKSAERRSPSSPQSTTTTNNNNNSTKQHKQ